MKLTCRICKYDIAILRDAAFPVIGAMFISRDEKHGVPAPWSPVVTWEYMYCPMCKSRPFLPPEEDVLNILTDEGEAFITSEGIFLEEDTEPEEGIQTEPEPHEPGTEPDQNIPVDADELFEQMIESGEIVQKGSWFQYKGENHRRDEIIAMLEDNSGQEE